MRIRLPLLFLAPLLLSMGVWSDVPEAGWLDVDSLGNPAAAGARLPRLTQTPDGGVIMSWVEPRADGHVLKYAVRKGDGWEPQHEVTEGAGWFVNWADFPSVTAISPEFWLAHWMVKRPGGKAYEYDISMAFSNDGGSRWRHLQSPHRDAVAAEHGFATIFPSGNSAGVIWLDGRYSVKSDGHAGHHEQSGHFNLMYTQILPDGGMGVEQVLDGNTCSCCWTSAAVTPEGPVVAWRGRTDDEIRDHRISIMRNGIWSQPAPLGAEGWEIAGCPVNGPSLASNGKQVVAAWFTAQGDKPRVRVAFSRDGGRHFDVPVEIDQQAPLGRIGLVWRGEDAAIVSWMTARNPGTGYSSIALRVVRNDGQLGPVMRLADISAGRDTGVPQMAAVSQGLLLAWTGQAPGYGIKTALLSWEKLVMKDTHTMSSRLQYAYSGMQQVFRYELQDHFSAAATGQVKTMLQSGVMMRAPTLKESKVNPPSTGVSQQH